MTTTLKNSLKNSTKIILLLIQTKKKCLVLGVRFGNKLKKMLLVHISICIFFRKIVGWCYLIIYTKTRRKKLNNGVKILFQ